MSRHGTDIEFKFHHGGLSVPNLDDSIAWYQRMLGFELERRFHIAPIPADVAIVRRNDMRLELFEVQKATVLPEDRRYPDRDLQTHGNKHVAFVVRDAMQTLEQLESRGADIAMVVNAPHGRGFFVRDNAGNLVEFVEEPSMWK